MTGNILITGGAGYIGSHTIIDLTGLTENKLISVDNFDNSTSQTFERVKQIVDYKITNYEVNLTDLEKTKQIFQDNSISAIIHFAAHKAVGESVENPLKYYHNNLQSLINLLHCCKEFEVANFIFSSSCTIYGQPKNIPVTESSPILPAESPYGNTKQIGEEILQDYCKANSNFKAIALRYFNPVGAHMSGLIGELPNGIPNNLVPFITQTAIGLREKITVFGGDYNTRDGSCVRDYIHVSDIAHAHTLALNRLLKNETKQQFEAFNLGTGNGVTVLEAIKAFEKVSGKKLNYKIGPRREGDIEAVYSDSSKANKELGWIPKHNLEDMMASAWKWELKLQENGGIK
ncbi:MAG: UDP-glucose 4-epimerase GalE [Flavobacteriales bacterium]|nr:UDP-glucose 4-epimerase GalE [Flavobacteriales bacterium]